MLALCLASGLLYWGINSPFSINPLDPGQACNQRGDQCQFLDQAQLEGKQQTLPLHWLSQARSEISLSLSVHVPPAGFVGGLGMCIPRSAFLKDLKVDDLPVQHTGQPARNTFLRPLHVRIISEITPGDHILKLNLIAPAGLTAGMSRAWIGSDPLMATHCQILSERIRNRSHNIAWVMATLGLVSFLLWYRLREPLTLTFSGIALMWVVHLWVVAFASPGAYATWWSPVFFATRVLFAFPMIWYVLQLSGRQNQTWGRVLTLLCVAVTLSLFLLPAEHYASWLFGTAVVLLGFCAVVISFLLKDLWHRPSTSLFLTVLCLAFVIMTNAQDFLNWSATAGYSSLATAYFSTPILCLVFGYQLIMKLILAGEQKIKLIEKFRADVEIQKQRIANDFEKIQQQREQLAVSQERKRLVRDMHDGLGSRLMAISARLKNPSPPKPAELEGLLDDSIQELRSVLDILIMEPAPEDDDDPISSLLGTLRWRMAPALEAKGVHLSWSCDVLPATFLPQDDQRLNLIRLWQEAFTNLLKHSRAKQASFSVTHNDSVICMELRDDGIGFSEIQGHGIGFKSMTARAEAMGGQFEYASQPEAGTRLRIRWPQPARRAHASA